MERGEQMAAVFGCRHLREKLDNSIYESETEWISEKLACFPGGSIDYQYGVCCHCYLDVTDPRGFMEGVHEAVKEYGASTRLEKLIRHCDKLRGTNLWEHHVSKVCEVFFEDEIKSVIDYLEDVSYAIYCGDVEKFEKLGAGDSYDCFVDNGWLDDYEIDEDGRIHKDVIYS